MRWITARALSAASGIWGNRARPSVARGPSERDPFYTGHRMAQGESGAATMSRTRHCSLGALPLIGSDDAAAWFTHCGYEARAK